MNELSVQAAVSSRSNHPSWTGRGTGVMAPAAGGDWYSVYTLLQNTASAVVSSSGNYLFQMIGKHPDRQILPILGLEMLHVMV